VTATDGPTDADVLSALERVLAGSELRTNARQAKLLRYLVSETLEGRGSWLKGTAIAMDVFGREADFDPRADSVVRSEARRLRHALASYYVGPGVHDPVTISIPKGSYVPQFSRRRGASDAPGGVEAEKPADAVRTASPQHAGRSTRSIAVFGAVLALIVGLTVLGALRAGTPPGGVPDSALAASPSVLVMPLDATGTLAEMDTLASGITAQLIADLMRFPGFRLYDYLDSIGQSDDSAPSASGAPAGADYLVRGVLRGDAEGLSLAMRLIATSSGEVVWSESFSRPLSPQAITEMQANISGEIAARLGEPYGILHGRFAQTAGAQDAQMSSFACVMQAYTYRHTNRPDHYSPARTCLEAAVVRDPTYAEAWAMLANLRLDGGRFGYDGGTSEEKARAYAGARAAAAKALSLEPENVTATSALAMIEHYASRFTESLEYSQRAVELNPNDPGTLGYHGWRLAARGHFEEGLPFVQQAIDRSVNPQPMLFHALAVDRLIADDMEGMLTAAQRAAADQSSVSDAFLAIAYGGLGLEVEAKAALDRMATKWPLLAQDPAAALSWHNLSPDVVDEIVGGLKGAGWQPPARE
jgi:TolB-like protein